VHDPGRSSEGLGCRRAFLSWSREAGGPMIRIAISQAAFEAVAATESDALWAR
jgi:hypothetical protein